MPIEQSSPKAISGARQPSWIAPVTPVIPDHELLVRIGGGSYGDVWLARSIVGTWRAVKVVFRDRFLDAIPYEREFSGIQKFEPLSRSNEGFIDILQIGRNDAQGYFYYVMELADDASGSKEIRPETYVPKTLSKALFQRGRLSVGDCLELGITLNLALTRLHDAGLIHRDIKPSNIIFVGGIPKLADIGLVIEVAEARSYVGTEGFIPPEGPNSAQADLYSLGKVLYEAGMGKDRKDFPEPPTQIAQMPDSSELLEFNAILLKACAANLKDRYQSAGEMNADLALLQSGGSVRRQRALVRRFRAVQRAGALVTVLAVLIGVGWLWQARQSRAIRSLAEEKTRLAEENRDRLVRQRIAKATSLMDRADFSQAVLWLAETLPLVETSPSRTWEQRLRLQSALDRTPPLRQVLQHSELITACGFSPDGEYVATAGDDRTVRVWSLSTGSAVSPPLVHATNVYSLSFSANRQQLVTWSGDKELRVWSAVDSWHPILVLSNVVDISPCADQTRIVVGYEEGKVELRDHSTGAIIGPPFSMVAGIVALDFSSSNQTLVVGCADNVIRCFSAETGLPVGMEMKLQDPPLRVQFSRDGRRLLTLTRPQSNDHGLRFSLWDPANGRQLVGPLAPHSGQLQVASLAGSSKWLVLATDTLVSYRDSGAVELWNAETGDFVRTLASNVSAGEMRLNPAGTVLAWGGRDGKTRVLDVETGSSITPPLPHAGYVSSLAFDANGDRLASADATGILKVWDLQTPASNFPRLPGEQQRAPRSPETAFARFSPDGHRLLTATAINARVWNTADWRLLTEYAPPAGYEIHSLFWNVQRGAFGCALVGPTREKFDVRLAWPERNETGAALACEHLNGAPTASRDGSLLCTIEVLHEKGGRALRLWRTGTGEPAAPPIPLPAVFRVARFSQDNRLVAIGFNNGTCRIWDIENVREVVPPLRQDESVVEAAFSPDGTKLVTGSLTRGARLWDLRTGRLLGQPMQHDGFLDRLMWSHDGRSIVSAGHSTMARQWDAVSGRPTIPPMEHLNALTRARYTVDDRLILTSSIDGTARIWSAETGEQVCAPIVETGRINEVQADEQVRTIVSVSSNGSIQVVPLHPATAATGVLRDYARAITSQELDSFEVAGPIEPATVLGSFQRVRASGVDPTGAHFPGAEPSRPAN